MPMEHSDSQTSETTEAERQYFNKMAHDLIEWFYDVTSQPGFEWPEDFDPEVYKKAADRLPRE